MSEKTKAEVDSLSGSVDVAETSQEGSMKGNWQQRMDRKKTREKQRRMEVNDKFDELMEVD